MGRRMQGIAAAGTAWLLALALGCGCRSREAAPPSPPAVAEESAGVVLAKAAVAPSPELPLGVADLTLLGWRERGGQAAFDRARAAERRGNWAEMVGHCADALRVDPTHLEASWLYAAGLSHLGRFAEVSAPLLAAIAGDPMKWALPALQLPLFAGFWASGQGDGLKPWIEALPPRLGERLTRSVILLTGGRLLAYDPRDGRILPLTGRLGVTGALVEAPVAPGSASARAGGGQRLAFLGKKRRPGGKKPEPMLGVIDLQSGALVEVTLPEATRTELVFLSGAAPRLLVRVDEAPGSSPARGWQELAGDQLAPAAAPPPPTAAPRLIVAGGGAELVRQPIAGVIADWDQAMMASALRIRRSKRLVAPPAPALIDGQRVLWSPGQRALALVASLEDCERDAAPAAGKPGAAPARRSLAFVVDPITGAARELAQSAGVIELAWSGDRLLAVASDTGVELFELSEAAATSVAQLAGDFSLGVPRRASRCGAEPAHPGAEPPPPAEPVEPAEPEIGPGNEAAAAPRPGDSLDDL
jgi:hypothetical protein